MDCTCHLCFPAPPPPSLLLWLHKEMTKRRLYFQTRGENRTTASRGRMWFTSKRSELNQAFNLLFHLKKWLDLTVFFLETNQMLIKTGSNTLSLSISGGRVFGTLPSSKASVLTEEHLKLKEDLWRPDTVSLESVTINAVCGWWCRSVAITSSLLRDGGALQLQLAWSGWAGR